MMGLQNAVRHKLFMLVLLIGVFPISIYGQDDKIAEVTNTYAITNVNVIQSPGRKIELGTVVVRDGIILSVGKSVTIPANAKIIKADSMYLYAGFIDGLSHVGVSKEKEEDQDVDDPGNPPNDVAGIQPERDVRSLLDPEDNGINDWRKLGFTAAHVVPQGKMLPGSGALILLSGASVDEMVYRDQVSLFSQLQGASGIYPNTVIGVMAKYRDLYRNATYAKEYKAKYQREGGVGMKRPEVNQVLEAFYPVIDKSIPVAFKAENVLDIQRVFTLKQDLGFNLILGEVKQGWDITDKIKSSNAKVFLSLDLPELEEEKKDSVSADSVTTEKKELTEAEKEEERLKERKKEIIMKYYQQPELFRTRGITYGFSTLETKSKDIKTNLSKLVEKGLSEDAALAALTTSPAQLLGVSSIMGTVDQGKIANLVISDKPYFEEKSNVKMVFVDGKLYEFEDKPKKKKSDEEDAELSGSWTYSTETPQGTSTGSITFEGTAGNYNGEITNSFATEPSKLMDIEVSGSEVSFSFTLNTGGGTVSVSVMATVDGDTFEGTMTAGDFGSFPVEGERTPKN